MTPEERELFDARARLEAWEWCRRMLGPWGESTRHIGSPELEGIMLEALDTVDVEIEGAAAEVRRLEEG